MNSQVCIKMAFGNSDSAFAISPNEKHCVLLLGTPSFHFVVKAKGVSLPFRPITLFCYFCHAIMFYS